MTCLLVFFEGREGVGRDGKGKGGEKGEEAKRDGGSGRGEVGVRLDLDI